MITYLVVTAATTPGVPVIGPPCPSIEKALCGAKSLLGDGAVTGLSRDRGDQAAFANCGHGGEIGLNTRPSPAPNMPL